MEKEKISIAISTYNRKKYLEKAIERVKKQTYKNWEIIIIDDCSSDGTYEYIEKKYGNDKKIHIYRNEENCGLGINHKKAIHYVTGEYILFLDDDDFYTDFNYFQDAINLFQKYDNLSMVSTAHTIYNVLDDTRIDKKFNYDEEVVDNKQFFLHFASFGYEKPIPSATILKRKALEAVHYEEMEILNDTGTFLRALLYGPMGFVNRPCIEYLVHGANMSFNGKVDFILQSLDEKYDVYKIANQYFDFTEEELKQWLIEQSDITILYFLNGTHPDYFSFRKVLKWAKKHLNSKEKCMQYKKVYKEGKNKEKVI